MAAFSVTAFPITKTFLLSHEPNELSVPPNKVLSTAPVVSFTASLVDETALATLSSVV